MLIIKKDIVFLLLLLFLCASYSCREVPVPKPKGHFRIDLPEKQYIQFNQQSEMMANMPFSFEYPAYGHLSFQSENSNEPGWFNIEFPGL